MPAVPPPDKLRVADAPRTLSDLAADPDRAHRYEVCFLGAPALDAPGVQVLPSAPSPDEPPAFAALRAEAARRFLHVVADYPGLCVLLADPAVRWVAPDPMFLPTGEGGVG